MEATGYHLTRKQLLFDLHLAYYYAARHKQKMSYVVKFKRNLKENLEQLCDDLMTKRYKPLPSKCFRRRLSEEARGVRGDVQGQDCASLILHIYTSAL